MNGGHYVWMAVCWANESRRGHPIDPLLLHGVTKLRLERFRHWREEMSVKYTEDQTFPAIRSLVRGA
ncbi:hypothetical protein V2G26_009315 [Clonostachys chloroleuca]